MIYVAASSQEMDRAVKWMNALRAAAIGVTCSWPEAIGAVGAANPTGDPLARAGYAVGDLIQIERAPLFWLLMPYGAHSFGAAFELGYAVSLAQRSLEQAEAGRAIYVSGKFERSIFPAIVREYNTDEDAFDAIKAFWGSHIKSVAHRFRSSNL